MLKRIIIKNYALIRTLEFSPSGQLTVITGETGAGKSIMLGALGLLLGNRADVKVLWDENEKCVIEGEFEISGYGLEPMFTDADVDFQNQTIIRREINPNGKSRAFINDTPVTLDTLRQIGLMLVDVHSQHETLKLSTKSFQLHLVDSYGNTKDLLATYRESWKNFQATLRDYEKLKQKSDQLRQESDFINFQLEELKKADVDEINQEALESEQRIAENSVEIKEKLRNIVNILSESDFSPQSSLAEAKSILNSLSAFSKSFEILLARLDSTLIELNDIIDQVVTEESQVEYNPEKALYVNERLDVLYKLLTKHRLRSTTELIALKNELQQQSDLTANLDGELKKAKESLEEARKSMVISSEKLRDARLKVIKPLSTEILKLLRELGMPEAVVVIDHSSAEPGPTGSDDVDLLFSANKGISPRPIAQVASGGEFTRLMFSIKYILAEKSQLPTLVLDEIDTGVSGEIAIKLGNMMKRMAANHQLITITHLPQIAARGNAHFFVYKDNSETKTISTIREVKGEDRIVEIAKMIGGDRPTQIALENAKELLQA